MILSAENLSHSYGVRTLFKNISFNIEEGDKIGVIGVNGTGKSTLLRDIATGEPSEGKITKNGTCVIEYLPQDPAFDPDATVLEQVFRGESPQLDVVRRYEEAVQQAEAEPENKAARQKLLALQQEMDSKFAWQMESEAKAVLDKLGITDLQQPMKELSGGQRKRVALAGVLVRPSDLLILDEPTAGLDPKERVRFRNLISSLAENRIVILSTHIVSDVEYIANEILIMKNGELIQHGSPEKLLKPIEKCVWECDVSRKEAEELELNYVTANLKHNNGAERLRIISQEAPCRTAWNVDPTLEDLYLYYFAEVSEHE